MHGQIEGDGNPRNRRGTNQLSVAEEGGGTVVIAMKEGYASLSKILAKKKGGGGAHTQGLLLEE